MQNRPGSSSGRVAGLVPRLAADRDRLVERILADVRAAATRDGGPLVDATPALPTDELEERRLVGAALDWILERLRADGRVDDVALLPLREAGAAAARRGEPVARPLDRVLSAGWVVWEAVVRAGAADAGDLAVIGAALLRIGDAAAAAVAAGHAEAEREAAARAAAARRELLDEILDLPAGDADAAGRLVRRSLALGLDPSAEYDVIVADLGRELGDEDPAIGRLLSAPAPRGRSAAGRPIAGTRGGRLVVLAERRWAGWRRFADGLAEIAGGEWVAVKAAGAGGITAVAEAAGTALAALRVALRLGVRGRLLDPAAVAFERLVLTDTALAEAAVRAELGPLLAERRAGRALVDTLAAYVATRGNARAAARRLGVAPRTVAYRLERARQLLGRPLEGDGLLRLAAAIFVLRILERRG